MEFQTILPQEKFQQNKLPIKILFLYCERAAKLYITSVSAPSSDYSASYEFYQMNWKTTPCLITKTEYLPNFIVKLKLKFLPASGLLPSLTQM